MHGTVEHDVDFAGQLPAARDMALRFTGSGKEYFRIWIVNLMLTVLTLGVYSAWAKVRRLRYFDCNTELDGAVFDFDGNPKAILLGRVAALALLAAYHYAFGYSITVGISVVLGLLAALPLLMRGALRFRIGNTRYRGLRFQFTGSTGDAYRAFLPVFAFFFLPVLLGVLIPHYLKLIPLVWLLWPFMHGGTKCYQHDNVTYASLPSHIAVSPSDFYGPYLRLIGAGLAVLVVAAVVGAIAAFGAALVTQVGKLDLTQAGAWLPLMAALAVGYAAYLMSGPYLQVRMGNLAWSSTSFLGVRIESTMRAREFMKLQAVNGVLTLLSLGLYRPFAVVRVYRYRIEHLRVSCDSSFEQALAGADAAPRRVRADGVGDFLGIDISW